MFDIEKELKDRGLDNETYEKILKDCENKQNRLSEDDWQDIVERYDLGIHYDVLRKACQTIFGSLFVKQYYEEKMTKENSFNEDEYLKKLEDKKRELEIEKIKYRDSRSAWQKQNYAISRIEENLNILEKSLNNIGVINFETHESPIIDSDNDLIIMLSDLHIGTEYENIFGTYNSTIAKDRLQKYINKILDIAKRHNSEKCYVVGLGDLINGNIRLTVQLSNRENLIEQIKIASELIINFCYQLTKIFKVVFYTDVSGNHSRVITNKEDAVHDERLDDLISWIVTNSLLHIDNFHSLNNRKIDIGIADINVRGHTYLAVHGDNDVNGKNGITNLCSMLGFFPTAILRGHYHSPSMMEYNNVKVIQGGSLCGSGGTYEIEKRLVGKPSQTVLVCNNKGIECIYNIELE